MPLHPQAQALVDRIAALPRPALSELTVQAARDGLGTLLAAPPSAVGAIRDVTIRGGAGQPLKLRAWMPIAEATAPRPLLLFIHGGGWIGGDLDSHDPLCRDLANASDCVVVAVDYRLAPEHKFPAGLRDCEAALEWVAAQASTLGARADRLAIGGDSAGGNLAAALAIRARDRGGPAIAFQLLVYPVTDHAFDTPSYIELSEGYLLTRAGMQWNWNHYLPDAAAGADPMASPLRESDLSRLPPTLLITAEFDPLRDEGEAYAARLKEAGVAVECARYPGMIHAFFSLGHLIDAGREAVLHAGAALRRALSP